MEIDDDDLIVKKLESRKRALAEEEKKIQEQDRLKKKHCKIQEELEELSYLLKLFILMEIL